MDEKKKILCGRFDKKIPLLVFFVSFALFAFIAYCCPLMSDDLEFAGYGFNSLKEIVDFSLYYGNGRLLGNIGAVLMSLNKLSSVLLRGFFVALLVVLIPVVAEVKNRYFYIVSFLLVFFCGISMFAQVYTWISGFQNYVPPIVFALFVCCIAQRYERIEKPKRFFLVFAAAVVSFFMQLYVEHCTVIFVLASMAFVFFCIIKRNGKRLLSVFVFISTSAGATVMFAIPKLFFDENNRTGNYREFLGSSVALLVKKIIRNALTMGNIMSMNVLLSAFIGVLSVAMIVKNKDCFKKDERTALTAVICCTVSFFVISKLVFSDTYYGVGVIAIYLAMTLFFALFAASVIAVFFKCRAKYRVVKPAVFVAVAIVCCGMLLFVSPIGDRCFLFPYVLLCIAFFYAADDFIIKEKVLEKREKPVAAIFLSCVLAVCVMSSIMFLEVKMISDAQDNYITSEMEKGATEIEICSIPYKRVCHDYDWAYGRYYCYDEWNDISFKKVDCNYWVNNHKEYFQKFFGKQIFN